MSSTGARRRPGPTEASSGSFVVIGRRPSLEAIRAGRAREILVAEGARGTDALREVLEEAGRAGVAVRRVEASEIEAHAEGGSHQGVLAMVRLPPEMGEGALARASWAPDALVLVLDGVSDPHNLGACARTAEAAGASALVTRKHRGAGLTRAAIKASAGALLHLPIARVANIGRALGRLRDAGFWVAGLEASATTSVLEASPPPGPLALVLGSEGDGLSRLVREASDELLSIPLAGRVGSLNVSVAAGIALFSYGARRTSRASEEG